MRVSDSSRVLGLEVEATLALCEGIASVRALTVWLLVTYREWDQLLDLDIDPNHYRDHSSFADDYLVTRVLSKNPRLPTQRDKRAEAIRKFYAAEASCLETNERIRKFREDPNSGGAEMVKLVSKVQSIIQHILGSPFPTRSDLSFCESSMRFGPGATTSISGIVTRGRKFGNKIIDSSRSLLSFGLFCLPPLWKREIHGFNLVSASKLTTVPKNAKTDRVICIEPDLNIFVQLGIGALIRRKLRDFGLDLNTQGNNQSLAREALGRGLATVDLSSASDTISEEVVRLLLPPAWVELLELARMPATSVDGMVVDLEKWSSMGNGYTFELETLIFYAIALAVTSKRRWGDVIAYGDDIILPAGVYPDLRAALTFLGFSVNEEKTFGEGLFYESCGTDWYNGHNVRPFFFRSEHHDFVSICYLYANSIRRWANRRNGGWSCDSRCLPAWLRCFRAVKPAERLRIPEGVGDAGFVVDFDDAVPSVFGSASRRGFGGYRFKYRRIGGVQRVVDVLGAYLGALHSGALPGSTATYGRETLRGRFTTPAIRVGRSFEWPTMGPWV